jgi:dehydrogenase/reductase SDR family protein 1
MKKILSFSGTCKVLAIYLALFHNLSGVQPFSPPVVANRDEIPSLAACEISLGPALQPESTAALQGVVCVVTGASRGIGKGIAVALGKEGATVYVTGTTSSASSPTTKETIESTAQTVTERGGRGIAVLCNHKDDNQVKQLFERVEREQGSLDILVNNAFQIPEGGPSKLFGKFWEQDVGLWDTLHNVGLRSHYVATCYAMPLLLKSKSKVIPRPLVCMISSFGGLTYSFNVAYGVAKAGVDRLVKDMAVDLQNHDICVVSLWPGVVRTETNLRLAESGEWQEYVGLPLDQSESPEFAGRAVVALARDQENGAKSGTFKVVAELAQEYGFTDVDGKTPPSIRSLKFLLPAYGFPPGVRDKVPAWLVPDFKLPFWIMAQGRPPNNNESRAI